MEFFRFLILFSFHVVINSDRVMKIGSHNETMKSKQGHFEDLMLSHFRKTRTNSFARDIRSTERQGKRTTRNTDPKRFRHGDAKKFTVWRQRMLAKRIRDLLGKHRRRNKIHRHIAPNRGNAYRNRVRNRGGEKRGLYIKQKQLHELRKYLLHRRRRLLLKKRQEERLRHLRYMEIHRGRGSLHKVDKQKRLKLNNMQHRRRSRFDAFTKLQKQRRLRLALQERMQKHRNGARLRHTTARRQHIPQRTEKPKRRQRKLFVTGEQRKRHMASRHKTENHYVEEMSPCEDYKARLRTVVRKINRSLRKASIVAKLVGKKFGIDEEIINKMLKEQQRDISENFLNFIYGS